MSDNNDNTTPTATKAETEETNNEKSEETSSTPYNNTINMTEAQQMAYMQANMGNSKNQKGKFFTNQKDVTHVVTESELSSNMTIYFKGCTGCDYTVEGPCTKILIESCKDCKITLKGRIITQVVEVWKCFNFELSVNCVVETLQADICKNLTLNFPTLEDVKNITWAGIHDLTLNYGDKKFTTGLKQVKERYADQKINDTIDQFIIRVMKGKLCQELVVRLENGFPTTEREAQEFDTRKEKNDKAYEEYIRKLILAKETEYGTAEKKVGRNKPCPCGSGKKYKKCCANKEVTPKVTPEKAKQLLAEAATNTNSNSEEKK